MAGFARKPRTRGRSGDRRAGALARRLYPADDFIALTGDLGAGKTTFARAFLRALTGDPELEAPSPTFTLIQTYDGPGYPIVHADFYRLRGADELQPLGWDELTDGAVTVVEWAERAASALPPDRLEIALPFRFRQGDAFRRVDLSAYGAAAERFSARTRRRAVARCAAGWSEAARAPLHGDASTRAYERLTRADGATAILMIAPPRPLGPVLRFGKTYPESPSSRSTFAPFSPWPRACAPPAYSTPTILAQRSADGLALLEDFGDETIAGPDGPNPSRFTEADLAARASACAPAARASCRSTTRPTRSRPTTSRPC